MELGTWPTTRAFFLVPRAGSIRPAPGNLIGIGIGVVCISANIENYWKKKSEEKSGGAIPPISVRQSRVQRSTTPRRALAHRPRVSRVCIRSTRSTRALPFHLFHSKFKCLAAARVNLHSDSELNKIKYSMCSLRKLTQRAHRRGGASGRAPGSTDTARSPSIQGHAEIPSIDTLNAAP